MTDQRNLHFCLEYENCNQRAALDKEMTLFSTTHNFTLSVVMITFVECVCYSSIFCYLILIANGQCSTMNGNCQSLKKALI